MPERFDVIIIGTGAGAARSPTRSRRPASGSCCSNGATSCLARWRTGIRTRCSSTAGTCRPTRGTTPTAQPFQPQVHYFVGGATKLYGAALYRLRPQDFGELKHVDGISPAWPSDLRRLRAVLYQGRVALSGARQPRRRPDRRALEQAVPVAGASRTSRGSRSSSTRSSRRGYHPFSAPCGILLDEAEREQSACIRCTWCDGYPCLVHAKSDAETIAVRPLLEHAQRDPARRTPRSAKLETDSAGRTVNRVDVTAQGQRARRTRPTSWCVSAGRGQQRQVAAARRRTTSTRTGSRTAPTRSAATTCSTTARRSSRWRRNATTPSSRRRSG